MESLRAEFNKAERPRKTFRRLLCAIVVPGIAVAASLVSTAPAEAQPSSSSGGNVSTVAKTQSGRPVTSAASVDEVLKFWTPERMAAAKDLDVKVGKVKAAQRQPRPTGVSGSVAPIEPRKPVKLGIRVSESPTVGKVYVSTPSGLGQCSASTVASGKRRLVVTAGHCVHGGAGRGWYWNFIFVPAYRGTSEPYGRFVAYQLTTRNAWINSSNYSEDMAFAIMNNGGIWGAKVVDTVGGNGLRWNWGYSNPVTILGYPAAGGFPGNVQYYCQSTTWDAHWYAQEVRAWCNMTQGASGGPWLQEYNASTRRGYVNSVVSHRHEDARTMDGPYFDNDVKSLYDFAESLSPA